MEKKKTCSKEKAMHSFSLHFLWAQVAILQDKSRGLSQLTAVPAWSSHWTEGIAVLPPRLAELGMREEKQACLRVRGVLQYLPYNEQIELKH